MAIDDVDFSFDFDFDFDLGENWGLGFCGSFLRYGLLGREDASGEKDMDTEDIDVELN